MKKWVFLGLISLSTAAISGESNTSIDQNHATTADKKQLDKHILEEIKREENFARTQEFKQGKDYNLSEHKVDPKDLNSVPVINPEYDFDMDDVYD
jgi:hypothetical protein